MFDNSNRKLVRVNGRAYVWVAVLDVVLLDENQRGAYPFGSPYFLNQPGSFTVEMNGWLSLPVDVEYYVWDVGPFQRFECRQTDMHAGAVLPTVPQFEITINGVNVGDSPESGKQRVTLGMSLYSDKGQSLYNAEAFVTDVYPAQGNQLWSLNGQHFPQGLLTIEGKTVKQIASDLLTEAGYTFKLIEKYSPALADGAPTL